jgi:hypothetical protein
LEYVGLEPELQRCGSARVPLDCSRTLIDRQMIGAGACRHDWDKRQVSVGVSIYHPTPSCFDLRGAAIAISAYEMVDGVEPDQPYQDEIDGDDVVQQPGHDQDQNAGDKGDERRDVSDSENHCKSPSTMGMIRRTLTSMNTLVHKRRQDDPMNRSNLDFWNDTSSVQTGQVPLPDDSRQHGERRRCLPPLA